MTRALWIGLLAASAAAAQPGWTPDLLDPEVQAVHYLPDFSYAGYRWGEQPLPTDLPDHTVLEATGFGAVAGDDGDDTAALQAALAAAHATDGPVVVRLPPGRLILTGILALERSDLVLQGAGSGDGGTTLYMPRPLTALDTAPPATAELAQYLVDNDKRQRERDRGIDEPYSLYSWSGGFVWVNTPGGRGKPYLTEYDREPTTLATGLTGARGDHVLTAQGRPDLRPGQIVQVNWFNRDGPEGSLIGYLYDGHTDLRIGERHWESPDMPLTRQEVTVLAVDGDRITIKEPLLHDLRPDWTPTLTAWEAVTEVGIEGIRFEFLYNEYTIHHVEAGNNAIYLTNTAHSWVRDVTVVNGDSGILTDVCSNVTIDGVEVYGRKYHYAVHMGDCYNVLARDVYVAAPVVHTFSFNTGSRMCVYTASSATGTPVLDQHSGLNYQNLFDDLTLYIDDPAHQPITGGGAGYWKPSHAAFPVFWNVGFTFLYPEAGAPVAIEGLADGPAARIVGMHANAPLSLRYGPAPYVEGLNRSDLAVPSLYDYQLRRRLGETATR